MNRKRRICVFSGTRAEYGLLNPLMQKIKEDDSLDICLMVSGSHLSPEFGLTYKEIEKDGFKIDEKIEILVSSDSSSGICKTMGLGMIQFADAIKRLEPDLIVLLGDRYEVFSVATAALVCNLPIAHIHGGESSFGSIDESFRHAITKMSHFHFTCADTYRDRVIQLGEHPDTVFNVGALGVENIKSLTLLSEKALSKITGFDSHAPFFLITYHPETIECSDAEKDFQQILNGLSNNKFSNYRLIFTHANADSQGRKINKIMESYVKNSDGKAIVFASMGQINYLSAIKYAKAIIGNSSSGILEAPSFKAPVINIGCRQKGRLRSDNIIDCPPVESEIVSALQSGLSKQFDLEVKNMENPFEKDDTAEQILSVIKQVDLRGVCLKKFYNMDSFERRRD